MKKPKVFIGSSSEGLKFAETIQLALDRVCEVTIWYQGVFGLSGGTLNDLVSSLDKFDFAILVLTPDDLTISRDNELKSPRDNVIFELGLFMGGLGRERTFIVHNREQKIKMPSDLAGISSATFELHSDGNLQSSMGGCCTQLKLAIEKLGVSEKKDVANESKGKINNTDYYKEREFLLGAFSNLKVEFAEIKTKTTRTFTDKLTGKRLKEDEIREGRDVLTDVIKTINKGFLSEEDINSWDAVSSLINIHSSLNVLIDTITKSSLLDKDIKIILDQLSLFYKNKLYILPDERGDEFCKYHQTTHKLPDNWISQVHEIENKLDIVGKQNKTEEEEEEQVQA